MKYLLFGRSYETLESVYCDSILNDGVYKTYDEVIDENIVYDDVEYIFSTWGMAQFNESEIKRYLPSLKCVFYGAGSVQYFARPFLNCGVRVFSAWGANAIPVAEYTVSQIILANKGFFKLQNLYRERGRAEAIEVVNKYPGNFRTKVGILGCGMIGSMIIEMLESFDFEILVYDPFLSSERAKEMGVTKVELNTVFEECQTISNHIAKNERTNGLIKYEHLSKMRDYATFINTARGTIVDEEGLKRAMRENKTLVAIIDVLDPDENRDVSDDIFKVENIIITPHIAGSHTNEIARMGQYMEDEYHRVLKNEKCRWEVKLKDLEKMA
ncbi:MAG: NAD(P)-dependent oxidoreductase [Sphaerochaeta sp.]